MGFVLPLFFQCADANLRLQSSAEFYSHSLWAICSSCVVESCAVSIHFLWLMQNLHVSSVANCLYLHWSFQTKIVFYIYPLRTMFICSSAMTNFFQFENKLYGCKKKNYGSHNQEPSLFAA